MSVAEAKSSVNNLVRLKSQTRRGQQTIPMNHVQNTIRNFANFLMELREAEKPFNNPLPNFTTIETLN